MTTRIFTLITGCRATRENNGLTFSLKELRQDEDGEVVIDDQIGTDVTVLTDDPVTDRGIEEDHITRAGHDVSGFAYCRSASTRASWPSETTARRGARSKLRG